MRCALCVGLRLDVRQTNELLGSLGYAFSDADIPDRIIRYCIGKGGLNIFDIKFLLNKYTDIQIGAKA